MLTELVDQLAPVDPSLLKLIISERHMERVEEIKLEREVIKQHNSSFADPTRIGAKLGQSSFFKN